MFTILCLFIPCRHGDGKKRTTIKCRLCSLVQDNIGSWLCEEMREEGVEIDQLDMAANTPLHLAARGGRTAMAATLLHLGASVHMKVLYFDKSLKLMTLLLVG